MTADAAGLESAAAAAYEVSRARMAKSGLLQELDEVPPPWEAASEALRAPWRAAANAAVDAYAAHLALFGVGS